MGFHFPPFDSELDDLVLQQIPFSPVEWTLHYVYFLLMILFYFSIRMRITLPIYIVLSNLWINPVQ